MKFRTIHGDPHPISVLAMGTHMNLGHSLTDAEAADLVAAAIDGGINLFDTADAYAAGAAEAALGKCLKAYRRDEFVILTKVGAKVGESSGLAHDHIHRQIDASLARLQTDHVDIYLCHHDDPETALESIVQTMSGLIDRGKIRRWGVSNWSAARIEAANGIARERGCHPITVCQPRYNLLYRNPERDLFPTLLRESIAATTFSPLAHGVLAGIYPPGQPPPPGTRAAMPNENKLTLEIYYNETNLERALQLTQIALDLNTTPAALATAWCAAHPAVTSVILGAWNAREMRENLRAADLELAQDTLERLDTLFPPPR